MERMRAWTERDEQNRVWKKKMNLIKAKLVWFQVPNALLMRFSENKTFSFCCTKYGTKSYRTELNWTRPTHSIIKIILPVQFPLFLSLFLSYYLLYWCSILWRYQTYQELSWNKKRRNTQQMLTKFNNKKKRRSVKAKIETEG